jgi:glucose/arabinose dehydrogenase
MLGLRMKQWLAAIVACAIAGAAPPALAIQAVPLGTFQSPVYVAVAPGAAALLFVVEQAGRIQVLRNEQKQTVPFLNIADLVRGPPDPGAGGEQGLLSVAFAPNYAQSRLFYVFFVNSQGDLEIDEFRRSGSDPLRADKATRRIVLVISHRNATNHNGGQLQFGPDGLLYVATGDGGSVNPRGDLARNLNSLLGKILRINPFSHMGSLAYRIPPANPFVGKAGRDEIYAYGFRNPWRFSIDNGRIAIGDVGQSRQEEVDFLALSDAKGANFGWPQYEGNLVFDAARPGPHPPAFPMFTYGHGGGRCAIIGGYVVRDRGLPTLAGRYIYGDACTGEVRSFVPNVSTQTALSDRPGGLVLPSLSSFGRGFGGRVYVTQSSGALSRLAPDAP